MAVPTWLAAVGTIGAFASGGVLLTRELRREREQIAEREKIQASCVSCWLVRQQRPLADLPTIDTRLAFNNAGSEPVYQVLYELAQSDAVVFSQTLDILPPGLSVRDLPRTLVEVWVKNESGWVLQTTKNKRTTTDPLLEPWPFAMTLTFIDPAGRKWKRSPDGSLNRVTDN